MNDQAGLLDAPTDQQRRANYEPLFPVLRAFLRDRSATTLNLPGVRQSSLTNILRQAAGVESMAKAGLASIQIEGGCVLVRRAWVPIRHRTSAEHLATLKARVADLLRAVDAGMIDLGPAGDSLIDAIRAEMGAD